MEMTTISKCTVWVNELQPPRIVKVKSGVQIYCKCNFLHIPGTHLSFVLGIGPSKNKAFYTQDKGYLGSRYVYIYLYAQLSQSRHVEGNRIAENFNSLALTAISWESRRMRVLFLWIAQQNWWTESLALKPCLSIPSNFQMDVLQQLFFGFKTCHASN